MNNVMLFILTSDYLFPIHFDKEEFVYPACKNDDHYPIKSQTYIFLLCDFISICLPGNYIPSSWWWVWTSWMSIMCCRNFIFFRQFRNSRNFCFLSNNNLPSPAWRIISSGFIKIFHIFWPGSASFSTCVVQININKKTYYWQLSFMRMKEMYVWNKE